jgi:DNA-directed RNA polymerase III subunit RPC8
MFILTTIADTIRVPAHMLTLPTVVALHSEIDLKYPNRVLMDVGLVVCRYGDCLKITNGSCVPGDGGSHHECLFRLCIFRPFVEEVCLGKIVKSTADGIQVSLGFFQDIFIPAYWMLRPSHFDETVGLWVWTPNYDEDEEGESGEKADEEGNKDKAVATAATVDAGESSSTVVAVKQEESAGASDETKESSSAAEAASDENDETKEEEEGDRFEMEIGSEIRFKVKSIHFTQVTNTAKGVQATTTTTAHSHSFPKEQEEKTVDKPLRKRSTSVDLSESHNRPASFHIVASICEDGLGLTSWWTSAEDDDDDDEEEGEEEGAEGEDGEEQVEEEHEGDYVEEFE